MKDITFKLKEIAEEVEKFAIEINKYDEEVFLQFLMDYKLGEFEDEVVGLEYPLNLWVHGMHISGGAPFQFVASNSVKTIVFIRNFLSEKLKEVNLENYGKTILRFFEIAIRTGMLYKDPAIILGRFLLNPPFDFEKEVPIAVRGKPQGMFQKRDRSSYIRENPLDILKELSPNIKHTCSEIIDCYERCLKEFEDIIYEKSKHGGFDETELDLSSVEIFVALNSIFWLLILHPSEYNKFLELLSRFLKEYVTTNKTTKTFEKYIILKIRAIFESDFKSASFMYPLFSETDKEIDLSDSKSILEKFKGLSTEDEKIHFLEIVSHKKREMPEKLLMKALQDKDEEVQNAVLDIIHEKKSEPLEELLFEALKDESKEVQNVAARSLIRRKKISPSTKDKLVELLEHPNFHVKKSALNVLLNKKWKPKEEKEKILQLVAEQKWEDLAKFTKPFVISEIKNAINDSYVSKNELYDSLYLFKDDSIVDEVHTILDKLGNEIEDNKLRRVILESLGKISSEKVITSLQKYYYQQEETGLKQEVIWGALSKINSSKVVEFLSKIIEEETDSKVKGSAMYGLSVIDLEDSWNNLSKLLEKADSEELKKNIKLLENKINKKEVLETLFGFLKHEDYWVRIEAIKTICKSADDNIFPILEDIFKNDPEPYVRTSVVMYIDDCPNNKAINFLLDALELEKQEIIEWALLGLSRMDLKGYEKAVLEKVYPYHNHKKKKIRNNAILALGNSGTKKALNVLENLLVDLFQATHHRGVRSTTFTITHDQSETRQKLKEAIKKCSDSIASK